VKETLKGGFVIEFLTYLIVLKGEQAFPELVSLIFGRLNSFISPFCTNKSFLVESAGLCHLRIIMASISSPLFVSSYFSATIYSLIAASSDRS
jgi:hypothetical protein